MTNRTLEKIKSNGYDISEISKMWGYKDEKPLILAIGKYDKGKMTKKHKLYHLVHGIYTGEITADDIRVIHNIVSKYDGSDNTSPKYPEDTSKDDRCETPCTSMDDKTHPFGPWFLKKYSHNIINKERYACIRCLSPIGKYGKRIMTDDIIVHLCDVCYCDLKLWFKNGRS